MSFSRNILQQRSFEQLNICLVLLLLSFNLSQANVAQAAQPTLPNLTPQLKVQLTLPEINEQPYHRPYVAVWVETPKRKPVHTLAFWREQPDWFKDLRQWWRKIGRKNTPNYDAATGATRKPGTYTLIWDGKLASGNILAAGEYVLHVESAREKGSREYVRLPFTYTLNKESQFSTSGKTELGNITLFITPNS